MRAMESAGVVRTLAEPNLTAISGESATFIAGGEFPIPGRLYLRPDHARLHHPDQLQEVRHLAQLHAGGADRGPHQPAGDDRSLRTVERKRHHAEPGAGNSLTIPSIKTRRAETTLEIPSGGAMAMAGLIQEQTKQAINGLPGPGAVAGSRRAVPQPRLRQQPDRTDGAGDALHRARGGAEGAVASG